MIMMITMIVRMIMMMDIVMMKMITLIEMMTVVMMMLKVVFDEEPGADPDDIDLESFGKKKKKKKVREGLDSLEDVKEALPEESEVSKFIMRKNITKIPRLPPRLRRN